MTSTRLAQTTLFTANLTLNELRYFGDMHLDTEKVAASLSDAEGLLYSSLYLEARASGVGHDQAMKSTNGKMTKIKKAIGYTHPKVDYRF